MPPGTPDKFRKSPVAFFAELDLNTCETAPDRSGDAGRSEERDAPTLFAAASGPARAAAPTASLVASPSSALVVLASTWSNNYFSGFGPD